MGHVSDILDGKGQDVLRIDAAATVYDAIVKMVEGNVGALLVYEGDRLAGIVTERDYLRRVTLQGRDERTTPVREVMSPELVFVGPDASVEECMAVSAGSATSLSSRSIRTWSGSSRSGTS